MLKWVRASAVTSPATSRATIDRLNKEREERLRFVQDAIYRLGKLVSPIEFEAVLNQVLEALGYRADQFIEACFSNEAFRVKEVRKAKGGGGFEYVTETDFLRTKSFEAVLARDRFCRVLDRRSILQGRSEMNGDDQIELTFLRTLLEQLSHFRNNTGPASEADRGHPF